MDKIRKEKAQKKKQRDLSQLPLTVKNIASICKRFQVSYNISNEAVFIRTAFSRWIVLIQDDKVVKLMLSRLVDTFFSRTSWTMLLYAENHSISVA